MAQGGKSQQIVYINGVKYYIHTVEAGQSPESVAQSYGISLEELQKANPAMNRELVAEQTLKIPVSLSSVKQKEQPRSSKEEKRLKREFVKHKVAAGETLYAISRRYTISVDAILEDNPEADPQHLSIGQVLLIRKSEIGRTDDSTAREEMEEYGERLNQATRGDGFIYHVVEPKETIYGISRRYGVGVDELIALNQLEGVLKAGAIIKVPDPNDQPEEQIEEEPLNPEEELEEPIIENEEPVEVVFQALRSSEVLHTALLLPLTSDGKANRNFTAFYQGFLMGLEDVKRAGYSVELSLFDTQKSLTRVEEITTDEHFLQAQLIVGPVYADGIEPVLRHAEREAIPVVTPLGDLSQISSDALFQMAPTDEHKYDKLAELIDEKESLITLIRTERVDKEFEAEILEQLGTRSYQYYDYASVQGVENAERSDLTPLLQQHDKHLFFVLADNEVDVDRILASLSSAYANMVARSLGSPHYTVVGNTRWNRYSNIDRTSYFKNRVVLFSLLHAKRDAEVVKEFDSRYIRSFGSMPNLYSYRGYETAVIFCRGMFSDIEYDMEGRRYRPLQTTYTFRQEGESLTHLNQEWVRVNYNPDFTITTE